MPRYYGEPAICFSPDGDTLAVATDGRTDLYDALNGLLNANIVMPPKSKYWLHPLQAIFTADGFRVFVLCKKCFYGKEKDGPYGIQTYDLAKQNVQLHFFPEKADIKGHLIRLSGNGSYVVYPGQDELNSQIRIWLISGGDYTLIPIGCGGKV